MPSLRRQIIKVIGYFLLLFVIAAFFYMLLHYEDLKTNLNEEIRVYGQIGLFIAAFIVDTIGGPLGPEVPVVGGLLAGINLSTVLYMTALGSAAASLLVYSVGYLFGEYGALHFTSKENFTYWKHKFSRHRRLTLVLGALTPVPYVTICLIGGVFRMRAWEFIVFAVGARIVRVALAAFVILLFKGTL